MTTDPSPTSRPAPSPGPTPARASGVRRTGPMTRSVVLASVAMLLTTGLAACSGSDDGAFSTLPPIQTTTTTSTTTTTISTERRFHVIQRGETLSIIAAQYGVPITAIIELNEIANPDSIPAGATIEIPNDVAIVNAPASGSDAGADAADDGDDGAGDVSDDSDDTDDADDADDG